VEGVGGELYQRYSTTRQRSLIAMVGRRAIRRVNGAATGVLVRPFVVMAARVLGPGPTRLRLVKLAHHLGPGGVVAEPAQPPAQPPVKRAA